MSFRNYVDDLAKRGLIDGNIADNLVSRHEAVCASPVQPVRDAIQPVLDEMFRYAERAVTGDSEKELVRRYAERIDDALEGVEKGLPK